MFSKDDLLQSFASVDEYAGCYFFQHKLPKVIYEYCLKSADKQDLLIISEGVSDKRFSAEVVGQVPDSLSQDKAVVFEIFANKYGFTHALVVPNTYHGSLKGRLEGRRENLYLCIPIYRCEFSGDESVEEFKELRLHYVPTLDWERKASPKLRVYFDNPTTGGGTDELGAFFKWSALLKEISNLNGVASGFIEVANWSGKVIEVVSPNDGEYILIRNRRDEQALPIDSLLDEIKIFAFT
ncbi:hypothetical protein [Pseudomonas sp. H9]|uniref:hypothetical protein n=1 Tax=Pseudomonas sp. H9 TaxID=483968 RepID=UPI00105794B1|nr:hypothetical protein [Pseudomonas sp. H9]TDF81475.1 hypothetical protein E1573_16955 [Pseudomonas sp. H9]